MGWWTKWKIATGLSWLRAAHSAGGSARWCEPKFCWGGCIFVLQWFCKIDPEHRTNAVSTPKKNVLITFMGLLEVDFDGDDLYSYWSLQEQ